MYSRRFRDRFHPRAITLAVAYSVGLAGALGVLQVSIARPASAGFLLTVNRDGLDLVVTAAGLAPGDDLTLVVPGVADQAATADGAGALQVRVDGVLPGCGRLTVVARTAHSGAGVGSWVDACLPFAPVVAATPQIIRVDDQGGYDVVGGGFVPQFPVQVDVDAVRQDVPAGTAADDHGDVAVRIEPGRLPCGVHVVSVTQPGAPTRTRRPASASAPVLVACPQVTVDPGSIRDADQPAPVRVQGRGFDFMRSATVLVDGASVATADVGIDGTVDVPIRAVGLTCGPHVVTLVAGSSQSAATAGATVGRSRVTTLSATTTMQVTCESPGDPPVVVPSVAASPAVVPRGRLVEISGARFAPGAVQIVVGGRPCAGATAVPDGTFSVTCVVHRLGRLDVTATAAGGSATTDVLGVPGPMEPGRHGFLVRR